MRLPWSGGRAGSMRDSSDEVLCERWGENPYYQLFCAWAASDAANAVLAATGYDFRSMAWLRLLLCLVWAISKFEPSPDYRTLQA
jgi:hypothetical protein